MIAHETLLRAAELLECTADALKRSALVCRIWDAPSKDARADHDEMLAIARELRREAGE